MTTLAKRPIDIDIDIFDKCQKLATDESVTTMTRCILSVFDDGCGSLELDIYDKVGNSQTIKLFSFNNKEEFLQKLKEY